MTASPRRTAGAWNWSAPPASAGKSRRTPQRRLNRMPEPTRAQLAELKIPAQGEFIGLAKRVATSLGGQLGFSLDDIYDLGIAVTQACGSVIEAAEEAWGTGATLELIVGT